MSESLRPVVQSLSFCCSVSDFFVTPWIAALQASLPFTVSLSSLKLMSIESVMPSNHLILCHPLIFLPSILPSSVQLSSVTRLCLTPCDPKFGSTPGLPVHHQLPEFTQTHVHYIGDVIQPSHPLSSPSPPTFNLTQYQGFFQWVSSLHQVVKELEFQRQYQSFQWIFRVDFL